MAYSDSSVSVKLKDLISAVGSRSDGAGREAHRAALLVAEDENAGGAALGEDGPVAPVLPRMRGGQLQARRSTAKRMVATASSGASRRSVEERFSPAIFGRFFLDKLHAKTKRGGFEKVCVSTARRIGGF